jgi:hypothetical protein
MAEDVPECKEMGGVILLAGYRVAIHSLRCQLNVSDNLVNTLSDTERS